MTFSYVDQKGHQHVVWYENEDTVEMKSRLSVEYQIAGVSVYALGHESESFWQAVQKEQNRNGNAGLPAKLL